MDRFDYHNRLYYVRMYSQYQGDVDDGLHIYFTGSDSLLGSMVVVPSYIRSEGTLPQSLDRKFQHQKMRLLNCYWTEMNSHIFSQNFYIYKY